MRTDFAPRPKSQRDDPHNYRRHCCVWVLTDLQKVLP